MSIIDNCTINPSADDTWELIDPHTKRVVRKVSAKKLWQKILETRVATGEPYICFIDTVQKSLPESQKKIGLKVHHSNLCSEITLPTNEERTAVCCLSSLNLEKYDEWKEDSSFIPDVVRFLDNVLEYFINNANDFLHRAKYSAMRERSIGLGTMGFHSYLQSKNIPFESVMAKVQNKIIFSHIKKQAEETSKSLGKERGEAPDMVGTGMRNAHLLAIAPNATSSIICGSTSPSIEPMRANVYSQKTMSGTFLMKNKYLQKILKEKGIDNDTTWKSILAKRGSVKHLEELSELEKEVFATAIEIDQRWIIDLAADRQQYICQSQSVNIFVPADVNIKDLHLLHLSAWKKGLKTLYYCRSEAIKRAEIISTKIERVVRPDAEDECLACQA
jgi:ribonucleoside-diphosphate reductase alpha chain